MVPGHPRCHIDGQILNVALQLNQVALQLNQKVEGVDAAQLTGVNQAHKQVPYLHPAQRPIQQMRSSDAERPFLMPFSTM